MRKVRPWVYVALVGIILVMVLLLVSFFHEEEESIATSKVLRYINIENLISYQGTAVGESDVIRVILREKLPAGEFVDSFDITLNKLTISYKLTERSGYTQDEFYEYWDMESAQQLVMYNASSLFALIRNLDIVEINIQGFKQPSFVMTRETAESIYGVGSLLEIDSVENFQLIIVDDGVFDEEKREQFFATDLVEKY